MSDRGAGYRRNALNMQEESTHTHTHTRARARAPGQLVLRYRHPPRLHVDQHNVGSSVNNKIVEIGVRCFFSLTACAIPNSQLMALLL